MGEFVGELRIAERMLPVKIQGIELHGIIRRWLGLALFRMCQRWDRVSTEVYLSNNFMSRLNAVHHRPPHSRYSVAAPRLYETGDTGVANIGDSFCGYFIRRGETQAPGRYVRLHQRRFGTPVGAP